MRLRDGGVLLVAVAFICTDPASSLATDWSSAARSTFINDCLDSCRKNPEVDASNKVKCSNFCQCAMKEGERLFTQAEYEQIEALSQAEKSSPAWEKYIKTAVPMCNQRAFGM